MLEPIKFQTDVIIKGIPLQWIPRFEIYYPDLPQFPTTYVHLVKDDTRIYGFPASVSFEINKNGTCDLNILFLSNVNLNENSDLKEEISNELKERFGVSKKFNLTNVIKACNGNKEYETFFKELWVPVSKSFGKEIPFGRFYEEFYSMVRFVSAWNPKTGKQSEMRMLYNFVSIFGEKINIEGDWSYLEFFLIPTYKDILDQNLQLFPEFFKLFEVMQKIWKIFFTEVTMIDSVKVRGMKKGTSWPAKKEDFIRKISTPLLKNKRINSEDKHALERLVDAFNRHGGRASFFISSIMLGYDFDYNEWTKDYFVKFYTTKKKGIGTSPKCISCFVQQGFGKNEFIPVDIWIESFYEHVLGIDDKKTFFNSFSDLGRIERIIWLSSQANKTNVGEFFDMMWCTRYGQTGNKILRGANPISCYECKLRKSCPGYNKIKKELVLIKDHSKIEIKELKTKKGKIKGKIISSEKIIEKAEKNDCGFICITKGKIPKKIFEKIGKNWELVDEFSGYLLKNQKTESNNKIISVKKMVDELPTYF